MSNMDSNAHTDDNVHKATSSAPSSPTSTRIYRQEPFDKYQHQVMRTLVDLFPDARDSITIGRLPGGSYNRITGVSVETPTGPVERIYRSPRSPQPVEYTVNMLQYLQTQTKIPVPKLVAARTKPSKLQVFSDISASHPLSSPTCSNQESFILMEKVKGTSLFLVYNDFSTTQKIDMARKFASLMADIFELPTPSAVGTLIVDDDQRLAVSPFTEEQGDSSPLPNKHLEDTQQTLPDQSPPSAFFVDIFERRRQTKAKGSSPVDQLDAEIYQNLINCATTLLDPHSQLLASFKRPVFVHRDLASRNIMVCKSATEEPTWSISGVLDWDECESLPPVCAFWSPSWLWKEDVDETEARSIHLNMEFDSDPDEEPSTADGHAIKAAFVGTIEARIPGYMDIVRIGYKAKVKQMLWIAQNGVGNMHVGKAVDDIYIAAGLPSFFEGWAPVGQIASDVGYASEAPCEKSEQDRSGDSHACEHEEIPSCFSTLGAYLANRRATRKEKLAKRRSKMIKAVKNLAKVLTYFTS